MDFRPLQKMWERVEIARQESDFTLHYNLLLFGEMLLKTVVAALVAAVEDDRDRHRYRLCHRLVRADGLGEWSRVLDEILTGPAAAHLAHAVTEERTELTQQFGARSSAWQYEAARLLRESLAAVDPQAAQDLPQRVQGRTWFEQFPRLRNRTRAHGATTVGSTSRACPALEESIRLMADNLHVLRRPWAYLHQNLSGKYRVVHLGGEPGAFEDLKRARTGDLPRLPDGIYVDIGACIPTRVELMSAADDVDNFFYPNGGWNGQRYECLSYITDTTESADAKPYLNDPEALPESETHGLLELDLVGETFTNLPQKPDGYVSRLSLERELLDVLRDERHPVVTLVGRGGIGKTWLALSVLHQLALEGGYFAVLWFSARDTDLTDGGARVVQPRVLTIDDVARDFASLVDEHPAGKRAELRDAFANALKARAEGPFLYVFDNFETLRSSGEFYRWVNTRIRLPNKILITTRSRDFKADYPVAVSGMAQDECDRLVSSVADAFGISDLITGDYRRELYQESDGHPYVIRILLGEVAKARRPVKPKRIVAGMDDILEALFQRTYDALSATAQRVFLTLCCLRGQVPQIALESVLLREANERMDVEKAVEELLYSSFVEEVGNDQADQVLVAVPGAAAAFGKRMLTTTPHDRQGIAADAEVLRLLEPPAGPEATRDMAHRVAALLQRVSDSRTDATSGVEEYREVLESIARRHPPAWLQLARFYDEIGSGKLAESAFLHYIESRPGPAEAADAWLRVADIRSRLSDTKGEIDALIQASRVPSVPLNILSNVANRLNAEFRTHSTAEAVGARAAYIRPILAAAELRQSEWSPGDCSRFAWLALNASDESRAVAFTQLGLRMQPGHYHCGRLAEHLNITHVGGPPGAGSE